MKEGKHILEARVLVEEKDILLRIQDTCKLFNVTEKYEEIRKQEARSGNALNLILANSFADNLRYLSTLNLNNVIITVKKQ
ncbi:MAG: hypothetical protein IJ088_15730 [Clostridia bacterium]|nr:hypothetical protein [Clostridia bacterium]